MRATDFLHWRMWLPLYLLVSLSLGFVDLRVRAYPERPAREYIPVVARGEGEAPGRYRLLAPVIVKMVSDATGTSLHAAWLATRLLWIVVAFALFHAYLRTWFGVAAATMGTLMVSATLPLTFTNSWAHPDHIPELALFTLGCLFVARRDDLALAATLAVATLNRETAVFLIPFYLVAYPLTRVRVAWALAFSAIWATLYIGLRSWLGWQSYEIWQFWRNVEFLKLLPPTYDPYYRAYAWFVVALLAGFGAIAFQRARQIDDVMRRAWLVVPIVLGVSVVTSSVIETRIFTPLFPLMVPAALGALVSIDASSPHDVDAGAQGR